jgi:protein required for attachment to host cells
MAETWVVVADSGRARFFEGDARRGLKELDILVAPELRKREQALASDRPGRIDTQAAGVHSMGRPDSIKNHERENFARRVATHIEDARRAGSVERLTLIAAPRFLGQLRAQLSDQCAALVTCTIDKDLTALPPARLVDHLPRYAS